MSALKLMTVTDNLNFIGLPFEKRKCQIENFEVCHVTKYIEKVVEQCECIPWVLSSALDVQVCFTFITNIDSCANLLQVSNYCSPNASDCYKTIANKNKGCNISCEGLHADITPTDDNLFKGFANMMTKGEF